MTDARKEKAIGDQLLRGWKEITSYTGFSKSTLKRWADKAGFPLRRTMDKGMVYVFAQEVDDWWQKEREDLPGHAMR